MHSLISLLIEYERAVCCIMINLEGVLSVHLLTQFAFLKQRSDLKTPLLTEQSDCLT